MNQRYKSLDGLRAYSAIGIILMHMYRNNNYSIESAFFCDVINSFTQLVYLFMIISAFSVSCGYFTRLTENSCSIVEFYKRRYLKILPFFTILVVIDLVVEHNTEALLEGVANITLLFGLLPNANISVIGVGWFLGTIFVFYLLFPFFCFLMSDKRRLWMALAVALYYNFACIYYFMDSNHVVEGMSRRQNILFDMLFFVMGCILYVYKEKLQKISSKYRFCILIVIFTLTLLFYLYDFNNFTYVYLLILFALLVIYAIGNDTFILNNRFVRFVAPISLEIYLSHMFIFRILQKLHMNYLFGHNLGSYIFTVIVVFGGTILFSIGVQKIITFSMKKINKV